MVAIFFHPDAVEGTDKTIVGRRVAGQSFLRGYLENVPGDAVQAVTETRADFETFEKTARALGERRPLEVASLRGAPKFQRFGTIFFPSPGYQNAAWHRQQVGAASCSLVGITHTVSTRRVMTGMHNLLLEPVQPWDAIICTSRAVKSVVQTQMDEQVAFIKERFGAKKVPVPKLPIIPLGVHAKDFLPLDGGREKMRQQFKTPDDAVVVLTVGRLTSVEKANPIPLFMALEQVAKNTGRAVHLWMTGWADRAPEMDLHREGAKRICPSVTVHFPDGRDPEIRRNIWAGADIFTLPVDNIQETFGLAPVEAMAAGLPVVMPDWNGFKDTIVDGQTGILIPTFMQVAGQNTGAIAARRFADGTDGYLHHLAILQQQTVIDVRSYAEALRSLVLDADLRKTLGHAAQMYVRKNFDWSAVIPQYLALDKGLTAIRAGEKNTAGKMPLQIDPFALYAGYPSSAVTANMTIQHRSAVTDEILEKLDEVNGRKLYKRQILPNEKMVLVSAAIEEAGTLSLEALARKTALRVDIVASAALFLAKYDFVSLKNHSPK